MKSWLMLALLVLSAVAGVFAQATDEAKLVTPAEQKFTNFPNVPSCFQGSVLNGDPNQGASVMLIKAAGRCRVPTHWHSIAEDILMVSGVGVVSMKNGPTTRLAARGYGHIPAKHVHMFTCPGPCSFFLNSAGKFDIHYVDDLGNEIKPEQALKPVRKMPGKQAEHNSKPPEKQ